MSSDAEQRPLRAMNGIFHHDGLIPIGTQGNDGDRNLHELGEKVQVLHGGLGKIFQAPAISRGALPSRQGSEHRLAASKILGAAGECFTAPAFKFIGDTYLNFAEFIKHIKLGDRKTIDAVNFNCITPDHSVEPAASPTTACGGAEFATAAAEMIVDTSL